MLLRVSLLCSTVAGCTVRGALETPCPSVRVNEVMTGQDDYEPIESDWFELENVGEHTLDLAGVRLQRPGAPPFTIPDGVSLEGGAYVVFLAAEHIDPEAEYLTTGFDFNKDSETLLLLPAAESGASAQVCEEVRIPSSHRDFSWQRNPLLEEDTGSFGEWCFATEPTPTDDNATCLCTSADGC